VSVERRHYESNNNGRPAGNHRSSRRAKLRGQQLRHLSPPPQSSWQCEIIARSVAMMSLSALALALELALALAPVAVAVAAAANRLLAGQPVGLLPAPAELH